MNKFMAPLIQDFSENIFENLDKKSEIAEQNKEDEQLRLASTPDKTISMKEESQEHLWGKFSIEQLSKSKYVADLEIVSDFNEGEAWIDEVMRVFDKLLHDEKISWEEYDNLSNQAVDWEKININEYLSNTVDNEEWEDFEINKKEERRNLTQDLRSDALSEIKEIYLSQGWNIENNSNNTEWNHESNDDIQELLWKEEEKNIDKWMQLFFSKDNPDLIEEEVEFLWDEEVQSDLKSILWNFLVNIEENNINELNENQKKDVEIVLNSAFDLQISKLINNKNNYPTITVENYITEIHNWEPIDKIKSYEELKQLVNNWEWISWTAMEKWKNKIMANIKIQVAKKVEDHISDLESLLKNTEINIAADIREKLWEELVQLKATSEDIAWWEVMSWNKDDKLWDWWDTISENA